MSATLLNAATHCRKCLAVLTLEEMHYLDQGDGMATCDQCETEWMVAMQRWQFGEIQDMPKRP